MAIDDCHVIVRLGVIKNRVHVWLKTHTHMAVDDCHVHPVIQTLVVVG